MHKYFLLITLFITACSSDNPYAFVDTSDGLPKRHRHVIPPPAKPRTVTAKYYIVKKGDTLSSISRMSGRSIDYIKKNNYLRSSNLKVGQKLFLPGVTSLKRIPRTITPITSSKLKIVRRSQWAKHSIKGNISPMGAIKKITVHHTDDGPKLSKMSDLKFLRGIENYHRNTKGWATIGYHFVIGRDGRIYEGRPIKYQGAHASPNNSNNLGISLIGDFNHHMPSNAQINSLKALLAHVRKTYKISAKNVYGHTHQGKTECPGKMMKVWVERYRRQ
ncbi:MAG: N-acetylmuramoyl-L-alanine amidase [Lentisphaeraceae bacterium]|nr:N-acetylmuramoyl-L-alanine amidase [Lentisphaeraceae bacterium]